jgi:hypothetical protein
MEQRAEVNKRNVQNALSLQHETQAPTHEELQLVKACWSQFGLFSCLDDETMLECAKCMLVCYCCIFTDCIFIQRYLTC